MCEIGETLKISEYYNFIWKFGHVQVVLEVDAAFVYIRPETTMRRSFKTLLGSVQAK